MTAPIVVMAGPAQARERTIGYLLGTLTVAPEHPAGYDRDLFPMWEVQDSRGCDTRDVVLINEARKGPQIGPSCTITRGRWFSAYDGVVVRDPRTLDIDHMVPLAEAWASGASSWNETTRRAYANDLGYGRSLIAVTASTNRSKGDQDPAEWLPPRVAYRCTYISDWIAIKYRWRLSMDATEASTLRVFTNSCGNPRITVPRRAPIGVH